MSVLYLSARKTESPPFEIDPQSGLIKLTGILPESIPFYTLNITAYDDGSCCGGLTTLSSDSYIVVEIKDTNNNQPQFPDCNYTPEVPENQNIGTFVVQVPGTKPCCVCVCVCIGGDGVVRDFIGFFCSSLKLKFGSTFYATYFRPQVQLADNFRFSVFICLPYLV